MSPARLPELSTGVDIVEIEQVARMVARYGERYLAQLYTPREQLDCHGRPAALAARFAAKEAVSKALGAGVAYMAVGGIAPLDMEIIAGETGRLLIRLHNYALSRAAELGLSEWSVSLSLSRKYAIAFVVAARYPGSMMETC